MRSLRLAFRKRMLTPTSRASVVEAHWCRREWPTRTGLASPQQVFLRHSRNERSYSQLDLLSKVPVSEALDERRMAPTGTSSIPDD